MNLEEAYQQGCQYAYQYFQMELSRQMGLHAAYNPQHANQNQIPVINFYNHYYGPIAIARSGSYARLTPNKANHSYRSPDSPRVVEEEEEKFGDGPAEMKEEEEQSVDDGEAEREAQWLEEQLCFNEDSELREAQWLGELREDDEGLYNSMDMDAYISL